MMTSRESTVTTVTRVDCVSQDSSRNGVLHVLRQLDTLLLGPEDEDNEAKDVELQRQMEPSIPSTEQQGPPYIRQPASQHQLLQQLLKNALENPESAVAAFNPDIGHLNAYQLLLSSLQDGHLAAAQTLLLLQLMHQASMQPQQSCSHGRTKPADTAACNECTGASSAVIAAGSSSDGNDSAIASRTVVWSDFVFRRLVDMILATQQVPSETAAAAAALPVVALRLLATAAASSAPGQVPAALTTAVQQIMTAAATAAESSAAAIQAAHSTVIPSCWLSDLGLSGLITLSDLISSWTIAAAAAAAGSNSTIIAAAVSLQLQLLQYIHHPTTAAAAATSDMDMCVAGISTAASSSINSSSSQKVEKCSSPERYAIQCQLALLVHQNDNAVVQAQSVHAASGGGKVTAAGSSSSSKTTGSSRPVMAACCAAAITVISNVTVMVLRLQEYKITMDKQVIKGVAEFVKSLIASSPRKAAQEFNWSGKPTGYALKQTAAETCRCSITATATATAANDASDTPYHCFSSWSCHNRLCYNKWLNTLLPQATSSNSNSSSSLGVPEAAQYPQTILEAAVLLLLAVTSCGGRTAAAELYRYDVSSMLEKLREFSNPRVLDLTEKVYGRLCLLSSHIKDEIMQDGNILALTGVMKCAFALWEPAAAAGVAEKSCSSSSRQRLLLAALSRLSAAVDAAGGSHILRFTGSLGTSAPAPVPALLAAAAAASTVRATAAQHAASSSPSSKSSSTVLGTVVDSATCVLHSSSCGLAALLLLLLLEVQSQPGGGGGGGLSQQLRAAAAQLFVAVLNRCRSMQHLQQHQVPRGGLWSQLGVTAVKQVEIIAMNRNSSSSSSDSACQERDNEQKVETAAARAMEAGGSVKPGAKAGKAEAAEAAAAQVEDRAYDEDGLRVVWSSGPSAATVAACTAWKQYSLHQLLTWSQSSTDLDVRLLLPQGTNKQDVIVSLQPDRITVRLSWYGRVVDGPLAGRIKTSEACWILDKAIARMKPGATAMPLASGAAAGGGSAAAAVDEEFSELQLLLPKENAGHFWRALFEGGVEKSHLEVLQEAITNEDDARCCPSVDQLGPEAALLYEELRERQEMMVSGQWDIENSFDDFRLVIGDNTL